jgi:hypothetical protein
MLTRKNITIKNLIDGLETTQKLSVIDIFPSVDKTIEELMKQIQTNSDNALLFQFNQSLWRPTYLSAVWV